MKPFKIYLDTSIISFLFADDAPEKQEVTIELFDKYIRLGVYEVFISDLVIEELQNTHDEVMRARLLGVLNEYPLETVKIQMSPDIEMLAVAYVETAIIPRSKQIDALHVATAVVNDVDVLLSWNYRHLANIHRERKIIGVNALHGYSNTFRIFTPFELIDYE